MYAIRSYYVRNILAVTGDPVAVGGESGATSVFDLNSIGLLELLAALNSGRDLLGTDLGGRTRFLLGAAFNPNLPSMTQQLRRLEKKVAAGVITSYSIHYTKLYDMFIVNPLRGEGLKSLFSTHPPVEERIRRLESMAAA